MAYAGWSKLGGQWKPQDKATWIINTLELLPCVSLDDLKKCSFMTNLAADSIASDTHSPLLSDLAAAVKHFCVWYVSFAQLSKEATFSGKIRKSVNVIRTREFL